LGRRLTIWDAEEVDLLAQPFRLGLPAEAVEKRSVTDRGDYDRNALQPIRRLRHNALQAEFESLTLGALPSSRLESALIDLNES